MNKTYSKTLLRTVLLISSILMAGNVSADVYRSAVVGDFDTIPISGRPDPISLPKRTSSCLLFARYIFMQLTRYKENQDPILIRHEYHHSQFLERIQGFPASSKYRGQIKAPERTASLPASPQYLAVPPNSEGNIVRLHQMSRAHGFPGDCRGRFALV